ncbi:MAG TPA: cytochrome c [Burkholderiaceae bacterium]
MNRSMTSVLFAALAALGLQTAQAAPTLERGRYLMDGVVACGNCHAARGERGAIVAAKGLSGGMVFDDPLFKAVAPNITPDAATGIGRYTDAQLVKAIREGVRPDGRLIGPPMPIEFYRHMSDDDVGSIVLYLRSQPPVANAVAKSEYRMPLPPNYGPPVGTVKAPPATQTVKYGEYLANIGHCMECHTARDAKGMPKVAQLGAGGMVFKGPWGESVSRNLTPAGLKDWTDAQIAKAIRTGTDRNGHPYQPPMAFEFYKNISDADIRALIAYLRTLKPVAPPGKG